MGAELQPGTIISGKFRVERMLGQGGMGMVLVASHVQLDQKVALKFLHSTLATNPDIVARFMREAQAAAKLRSDHVCRVIDVAQLDDGTPYIVMEMLEGEDLSTIARRSPLTNDAAARHVLQACIALAEAHAIGIVHRDLKPANLFLARRPGGPPIVKVLDFGIAKAPLEMKADLTSTTALMGSPGYMSPEQMRSAKNVDARTDIWALGVVLYELVRGTLPFRGESLTELSIKVATEAPERLGGDPLFERIVMRCLEKELAARYPDVAELAADLAEIAGPPARETAARIAGLLGRAPMLAPVAIAQTVATDAPRPITPQSTPGAIGGLVSTDAKPVAGAAATAASVAAPAEPGPPSSRRGLVVGGLVLAGLVGGAVWWIGRGASSTVPDARIEGPHDVATPTVHDAPKNVDAPVAREGFVRLPGGTFTMGSTGDQLAEAKRMCKSGCRDAVFQREANPHQVTLTSFEIMATEVTRGQFATWLARANAKFDGDEITVDGKPVGAAMAVERQGDRIAPRGERVPMVAVTYDGAAAYCTSIGGLLPTEAQWEYAARGNAGRVFPWGNESRACGVALTCGTKAPAAVGTSQDKTPDGIFDLGGNVAEIVRDGFRDRYDCPAPCRDPLVPIAAEVVVRGGDFEGPAWSARAAERGKVPRSRVAPNIGFRCVMGEPK